MNGFNYILSKQLIWAKKNKIKLIGSQTDKGQQHYTEKIDQNLFEPLMKEVYDSFKEGDGGELIQKDNHQPKMCAVHSSSALGVNIFHYWKTINKIPEISNACGLSDIDNKNLTDIKFEQKFSISDEFPFCPNIDVLIDNNEKSNYKIFAIECKFSEAYSSRTHGGIDEKYLKSELQYLWTDIPNLHQLANTISPNDNEFGHLHAAQLIKHILGLKRKFGRSSFRLLYLWYDVLGSDGYFHRKDIEKFCEYTKADNIKFHAMSYQELIFKLIKNNYIGNEKYIDYIADRYL